MVFDAMRGQDYLSKNEKRVEWRISDIVLLCSAMLCYVFVELFHQDSTDLNITYS